MKGAINAKNILVPTLIFACIALFYIDGIMNEGFQPSGGSCPLLVPTTPNTTIYSIYVFKQTAPPKLIFKMIEQNGITSSNNFGFIFKSSSTNKLIISNIPKSSIVNYQVYGRQTNNWTAMSCLTRSEFAIETGNNTIYKVNSSLTGKPGAIALNPPNTTPITNNTIIFILNGSQSITGMDTTHQNSNIRIDLQITT